MTPVDAIEPGPATTARPCDDGAVSASPLLVLTTLPDVETARTIARQLVQRHLAACGNILPPCESLYHWNHVLEQSQEVPLLLKTTRDRYAELEKMLLSLHPYDLPEIIALSPEGGLRAYLDWIIRQTR